MADVDHRFTELARAIRGGDERAFRVLFELLYSPLVVYAAGFSIDRHLAEDFAQEAFVRLWQIRERLDPRSSIRSLLFVTVRNLTLNSIRMVANHKRLQDRAATETTVEANDGAYDIEKLRQFLHTSIKDLPDREREAFELSRFAELTHREIADVMEISKATVEKHVTNALRALRERLKAYDPELMMP